jgi:hypothetical protein
MKHRIEFLASRCFRACLFFHQRHDRSGHANDRICRNRTEHLFGFLTGIDVGKVGEKEIESETTSQFGKRIL